MAVHHLFDLGELFTRIANGDEKSFSTLFDLYKKKVYSTALKMLKSESESEEIVQEVFISLWKVRNKLGDVTNPEGYIFTITYNTVYSHLRKISQQQELLEGVILRVVSKQNTTLETIAANETSKLIYEALQKLPPQQRKIYDLARHDEMSYDDIASELGLSKNTVRNHLAEAMKSIRYILKKHITSIFFTVFFLWVLSNNS